MTTKAKLVVALVLSTLFTIAQPATINFVATDLTDTTPGQDLWRYDYTVSGRSFLQFEFFDVYFSPTLYRSLTPGPSPNPDWNVAVLQQPNPANLVPFDRGMFDSFATAGNPSLTGMFSVNFVYLGPGTPGIQPFEIFGPTSRVAERGFTSAPVSAVPEPSTAVLSLIGFAVCTSFFRRRFQSRRSN